MVDLRAAQQRLGRDAAPVEADAAELVALDDRGLHAELRRADRRDIAARPAAEHDQVEGIISHAPTGSQQHRQRVLDELLERGEELRADRAVDDAMVAGRACSSSPWRPRARHPSRPARCSPAPTARMPPCGGLMTAANSRMPYMPRLEIEKVPPWNSSSFSLPVAGARGEVFRLGGDLRQALLVGAA